MILAEAPSGKYWVIEATLTSAMEEKEKPRVINAALSAVEIEDFLVILVLLWLLFSSRRIIISSELNRVNHFLFSLTAARLQDVVVVLFYQISRKKNETNSNDRARCGAITSRIRFLKE